MAQLDRRDNLDRWDRPDYRLITMILMRCGLRISDACKIPSACLVTDADGATDASLLRRLEAAHAERRRLQEENTRHRQEIARARRQIARALGEQRQANGGNPSYEPPF